MPEICRKLVIVGGDSSGKTSLLTAFAKGNFREAFVPTLFQSYVVDVDVDGKNVALDLWDTPGHEHYGRLRSRSYCGSHVVLISFPIDSPDRLDNIQEEKWVSEVAHFCPSVPMLLVGCKQDLRSNPRVIEELKKTDYKLVTPEEGLAVSQVIGTECYFECSARTGEGVQEALNYAARAALLRIKKTGKCLVLQPGRQICTLSR